MWKCSEKEKEKEALGSNVQASQHGKRGRNTEATIDPNPGPGSTFVATLWSPATPPLRCYTPLSPSHSSHPLLNRYPDGTRAILSFYPHATLDAHALTWCYLCDTKAGIPTTEHDCELSALSLRSKFLLLHILMHIALRSFALSKPCMISLS